VERPAGLSKSNLIELIRGWLNAKLNQVKRKSLTKIISDLFSDIWPAGISANSNIPFRQDGSPFNSERKSFPFIYALRTEINYKSN
jgi:hypothetical protein